MRGAIPPLIEWLSKSQFLSVNLKYHSVLHRYILERHRLYETGSLSQLKRKMKGHTLLYISTL
jgi:hypothetical protein